MVSIQRWSLVSGVNVLLDLSPAVHRLLVDDLWPLPSWPLLSHFQRLKQFYVRISLIGNYACNSVKSTGIDRLCWANIETIKWILNILVPMHTHCTTRPTIFSGHWPWCWCGCDTTKLLMVDIPFKLSLTWSPNCSQWLASTLRGSLLPLVGEHVCDGVNEQQINCKELCINIKECSHVPFNVYMKTNLRGVRYTPYYHIPYIVNLYGVVCFSFYIVMLFSMRLGRRKRYCSSSPSFWLRMWPSTSLSSVLNLSISSWARCSVKCSSVYWPKGI